MFKVVVLISAALAVMVSPQAVALPASDTAEILRTVLSVERQRHPPDHPEVSCLERTTSGIAFSAERAQRQYFLKHLNGGRTDQVAREEYESMGRPSYRWHSPADVSKSLHLPELDEAAGRLIRSDDPDPSGPLPIVGISDFSLCGARDARGRLSISTPAYIGDLAFVDTGYGCGPLCGQGMLYAFRRTNEKWQLVAIADTWVS